MDDEHYRLYRAGCQYQCEGEFAKAIDALKASFAIFPHSKTAQVIGECLLSLGDRIGAIIYFAAACGLGMGRQPKAAFLLAEALLDYGCPRDAKRAAEWALEALPHFEKARALLQSIDDAIATRRPASDTGIDNP
jgi:tetratricopeptide (TPR) repeat protein